MWGDCMPVNYAADDALKKGFCMLLKSGMNTRICEVFGWG